MKKLFLLLAILGCLMTNTSHAQLVTDSANTIGDIVVKMNELIVKGDSTSKLQIEQEVAQMVQSDNEVLHRFAIGLARYHGWEDRAEEIDENLLHRFPQGLKARDLAFEELVSRSDLTAAELEKNYMDWTLQYPAEAFKRLIPGDEEYGFQVWSYYDQARLKIVQLLIEKQAYELADKHLDALQESDNLIDNYSTIGEQLLDAGQTERAVHLIEQAYNKVQEQLDAVTGDMKSYYYNDVNNTKALYARALVANGETETGTNIAQELYEDGYYAVDNGLLLASHLGRRGKHEEAFTLLETHILKNGKNTFLMKELEHVYGEIHADNTPFADYEVVLDQKLQEAVITLYREELIKKETPSFSLTDQEGNVVTLDDFKDKMVILDFWATWCGPCTQSFPGMQTVVNKYRDDENIVFLFVNTSQREENYKEVVNTFIANNNYTFDVVFDEMKDRPKSAATAFGIQGIPTKIIIDKEGYTRFQSAGSSSVVDEVVREMDAKIQLVKTN